MLEVFTSRLHGNIIIGGIYCPVAFTHINTVRGLPLSPEVIDHTFFLSQFRYHSSRFVDNTDASLIQITEVHWFRQQFNPFRFQQVFQKSLFYITSSVELLALAWDNGWGVQSVNRWWLINPSSHALPADPSLKGSHRLGQKHLFLVSMIL